MTSPYAERGLAHAALRLLLQDRISTMKCLEILEALTRGETVDAPWDEVNWCEDLDPGVIAQEFFQADTPEKWERLRRELEEAELLGPEIV